jgi:hypothetical protein
MALSPGLVALAWFDWLFVSRQAMKVAGNGGIESQVCFEGITVQLAPGGNDL